MSSLAWLTSDVMLGENYPQVCEEKSLCGSDESIKGNLERKRVRLMNQLDEVNQALDALDKNPEMLKVLELVNKARR